MATLIIDTITLYISVFTATFYGIMQLCIPGAIAKLVSV